MAHKNQKRLVFLRRHKTGVQKGFTIIELMIAVSVFALAIMLVTMTVIGISRSYQQGATKAKLLTTSREIHAQFTQFIQYGGSANEPSLSTQGNWNFLCIGNIQYIYWPNNYSASDSYLFVITYQGDGCSGIYTKEQPLPPGTVVTNFSVTGKSPTYTLYTRFVTGDNTMFINNDYNNTCRSNILGEEFCAVISLSSTVSRKVI